ncbi:fungal-specific transcription factor domain-domain-containing protein [Kockovaella imperatae]|uniref:Fungal-specific transcription factor domain-domain-containing protein n=1 Tax=Kockovaella imperatae TaxID=4999 RepID=A0A1Y1URJ7_9TREE|nr:fungal-specific transcription factor domain-domain-containing protein [Kockovaella imperatae]ORX40691.1 fungal-specific transcription factor domain-domain-containing protein [Kockovaella imperatae]
MAPPPEHQQQQQSAKKSKASIPNDTVDLTKVRAYAACRSCRQKKVRCLPASTSGGGARGAAANSDQPGPCQQCISGGIECTYPPTRDRAAYSRQYVQNLEARVQALEMTQSRMLPMLDVFEKDHPGLRGGTPSMRAGSIPGPIPGTATGPHTTTLKLEPGIDLSRMSEDNGGDQDMDDDPDLHESSESLSPDGGQITQDDRGNYRWIGSSNTLSLLDSLAHRSSPQIQTPPLGGEKDGKGSGAASASSSNPYFGPVAGSGVVNALPGVNEVIFPEEKQGAAMIDAFFRDVYPILPVVVEEDFRKEHAAIMERRSRGEPEKPGGFISVVFAIYALGERVLVTSQAWQRERSKVDDNKIPLDDDTVLPGEAEAGVIWYERAQILHYTTLKDVNIHQVQCLTLMAAFQASVNAMPMSWLLAGQAIRVAQDLGLHRSTARMGISLAEKQIRARCWWSIYGLERLVSVSLGRPLGIEDLDIDVALPLPVDDTAMRRFSKDTDIPEEPEKSTISGFIALTKLCKIAGRVAQLLYRPSNGRSVSDPSWSASQQSTINKLDRLLKDWLENDVPSKYKDPSSTTSHSVQLVSATLSNAYFTVLLTLHRNFLPSNPDYPRPRPPSNSQSLSHLVEAARSVIHVASQQSVLLAPSHHLSAYCHNLWSSAVVLLLCEVQARDQIVIDAVGSSVESCRKILQALEPAWPGSRKLKELLNDAEARAKEVALGNASGVARPMMKKRKTSSNGSVSSSTAKRPSMGPPPDRHYPNASPVDPRRAYETSNTRTMVRDDDIFANFSNGAQQSQHHHHQQQQQPQRSPYTAPSNQLHFTPNQLSNANNNPFDSNPNLFDVGGVTFDGLEMLQGFTNTDAANFWNSFISPTGQANYVISGQNTPNSNGPSPGGNTTTNGSIWQQNAQIPGSTPQASTTQIPGQSAPGLSPTSPTNFMGGDFWSQLAPGGGFDWAADPSVPFNI